VLASLSCCEVFALFHPGVIEQLFQDGRQGCRFFGRQAADERILCIRLRKDRFVGRNPTFLSQFDDNPATIGGVWATTDQLGALKR
jgi:hypothetical protein